MPLKIAEFISRMINKITNALRPSPTFAVDSLVKQLEGADPELKISNLGLGEPAEGLPIYVRDELINTLLDLRKGKDSEWRVINKYNPSFTVALTEEEKSRPENKGKTHKKVTLTERLKKNIQDKFSFENHLEYEPKEISVSNGGKQILFNAFSATLNPGDKVLLPEPSWVSYVDMVKFITHDAKAGIGVKTYKNDQGNETFKINKDTLMRTLKDSGKDADHIKWLVLNSPSNPTGATYTMEELKGIASVILSVNEDRKRRGVAPLMVLSDDIYEHMVYQHKDPVTGGQYTLEDPNDNPHTVSGNIINADPRMKDYTLIANGVAKAFSMTGIRIGFAAGPKEIIKAMDKLQGLICSNPSTLSQLAAMIALDPKKKKERGEWYTQARELYDGRMKDFKTALMGANQIKWVVPPGAFYAFADFSAALGKEVSPPVELKDDNGKVTKTITKIESGNDMAAYLTKVADAAGVPGDDFFIDTPKDENGHNKVYVRFSLATGNEILKKAGADIADAMNKLMGRERSKLEIG